MPDALRPILELSVVLPGLLLAYIPVKTYLKQTPARLLGWLLPLFAALAVGGGLACWRLHVSTAPAQVVLVLAAIAAYIKTLRISLWKSATVALSGRGRRRSFPLDGGRIVVLPAGGDNLQRHVLARRGACVLSCFSCGSQNGRG